MNGSQQQPVIKVFLVNGESRSLRLDAKSDVTDIIRYILQKIRMNLEVSLQLFGILLKHDHSSEAHWLQAGFPVMELLQEYCSVKPLEEWKFLLRIRILPKTAQQLKSQDHVAFQYFYDQILHMYLEDNSVTVDNDTAVRLGCLELRRFFKDMPQIALKRKENFTMLERDIGLEKFFKKSLLSSVRRKSLRSMVLSAFQQYESLTMEGCVFQFFNLLAKHSPIDVQLFHNCALGDDLATPLTCTIAVGPNCEIQYQMEGKDPFFLASFNDVEDITYEAELGSRGRLFLELRNAPEAVVIRTAHVVSAVHLATLIDGYCMVYTQLPTSRLARGRKRYSNSSRFSGLYSIADDDRYRHGNTGIVDPYLTYRRSNEFTGEDYSEIHEPGSPMLGAPLNPRDIILGDKIGEGQFGDVHKGVLHPNTPGEMFVAIKTCKVDASHDDKAKFLEEAAIMRKFSHPHIIRLFGVMSSEQATYIIMELAPTGQLRRYLLTEGSLISRFTLLQYLRQLASAMVHLESKNYVHRDIAARNVLVASPETIKLADFGLSRGLDDTNYYVASRGKLPIKWMAPESINFRRFTSLSDVWMFGVCCWEVIMRGVKPFVGIKNDEVISKIEFGERLPLPPDCPASLYRLMNACWQYDPQDRPNFSEVEQAIEEIIQEEQHSGSASQRRIYDGIQRDPTAPEKPRRPPSQNQLRATPTDANNKRLSQSGGLGDEELQRQDQLEGEDNSLPLPPRLASRFRELSMSPQGNYPADSILRSRSTSPPPKPPRRFPHSNSGDNLAEESRFGRVPSPVPQPAPIQPYSVTTITPRDPGDRPPLPIPGSSSSRSPDSPISMAATQPIPPPSIISQPRRGSTNSNGPGIYYSLPAELEGSRTGPGAMPEAGYADPDSLSGAGFDRRRSGQSFHSHDSTRTSSNHSSGVFDDQCPEVDDFSIPEDDSILQQTTAVVKSVMELSNKVPLSRPGDYVELVKNVGLALRELLGSVDDLLNNLPEHLHHEVLMAHKVLSADMSHLVGAMKNAQKQYQTFLEQEYQKQMLQAAHIVAVNSKLLLDATNSARRKAYSLQR